MRIPSTASSPTTRGCPTPTASSIYKWVKNGQPEGDPADLPPPPKFVDGWQIPKPDIVYRMPQPYTVPAKGVVEYQHFKIDAEIKEDMWVRAAEMRPGNRAVVHHLILFFVKPGQKKMRGEDALANGIATFAPGLPAMDLPEGYAFRVPAGSRLVMQAHYTPNGTEQTDQSFAGIVLADPKTVKHEISINAAMNFRFLIPPGDKDYAVRRHLPFSRGRAASTRSRRTCTTAASRSASRPSIRTAAARFCSTCRATISIGRTNTRLPSRSGCPKGPRSNSRRTTTTRPTTS